MVRHRNIAQTYKERWLEAENVCKQITGNCSKVRRFFFTTTQMFPDTKSKNLLLIYSPTTPLPSKKKFIWDVFFVICQSGCSSSSDFFSLKKFFFYLQTKSYSPNETMFFSDDVFSMSTCSHWTTHTHTHAYTNQSNFDFFSIKKFKAKKKS